MHAIQSLPKNLILVGYMGSGKTTVSRDLLKMLGNNYTLLDMDEVIEREQGMKITELFERFGESFFREQETALLKRFLTQDVTNHIIATGGGVVLSAENRLLLKQLGYVVWLDASLSTIVQRVLKAQHRPLLQVSKPKEHIELMMQQREPLYQDVAHLKVETSELNSWEIALGILESARYFFKKDV